MAISGVSNPVSSVPSAASQPVLRAAPQTVTTEKDSDLFEDLYQPSLLGRDAQEDKSVDETLTADGAEQSESESADKSESEKDKSSPHPDADRLTPNDLRVIADLQLRDREVRAHESAHKSAGGGYVGGASYTYQQGPDGRQYAIGGEVSVQMSTAGSDPESIIAKMAQIRAAALAPADPSSQDRAVAATATAIAEQARETIRSQERNERAEAAAKEQAAAEQTSPDEEDPSTTSEPVIDLLGSVDPKTVNALAAYEASQQRPYLSGVNLVG